MQRLPAPGRFYRHYFLLYPLAVEGVNLQQLRPGREQLLRLRQGRADAAGRGARLLLLHADALGVAPRRLRGARALRPARSGWPSRPLLPLLRRWDLRAARRPDYFVTTSRVVADRIERCYGRRATVIPPPIDVARFRIGRRARRLLPDRLAAGRLQAHRPGDRRLQPAAPAPGHHRRRPRSRPARGPGRPDRHVHGPPARRGRERRRRPSAGRCSFRARRTSASRRSRPTPRAGRWSPGTAAARSRRCSTARPACSSTRRRRSRWPRRSSGSSGSDWSPERLRAHAAGFDRPVFVRRIREFLHSVAPEPARAPAAGEPCLT